MSSLPLWMLVSNLLSFEPSVCYKHLDGLLDKKTVLVYGDIDGLDLILSTLTVKSNRVFNLTGSYNVLRMDNMTDGLLFLKDFSDLPWGLRRIKGRIIIFVEDTKNSQDVWRRMRHMDALVFYEDHVYVWPRYSGKTCFKEHPLRKLGPCSNASVINIALVRKPKNITLFPGCPLTVIKGYCPPYLVIPPQEEDALDKYGGPEPTIVHTLGEHFRLNINFISVPQVDFRIEENISNFSAGALDKLWREEADLAMACLSLNYKFTYFFDHLPTHIEDSLTWFTPAPLKIPKISGIYKVFKKEIWEVLFGCYIFFAITLCFASEFRGIPWGRSLVQSVAAFITSPLKPKYELLQVLVTMFQFFAIHMIAFYQGTLLYSLFRTRYQAPYASEIEAIQDGLYVEFPPPFEDILQSNHELWDIISRADHKMTYDIEFNRTVLKRDMIALATEYIDEATIREMFPYHRFEDMIYKIRVKAHPTVLYMSPGSPFFPYFKEKLSQMIEGGLPQIWLLVSLSAYSSYFLPEPATNRKSPLGLEHLQTVFFFLLISLLVSCFAFAGEVYYFRRLVSNSIRRGDDHLLNKIRKGNREKF